MANEGEEALFADKYCEAYADKVQETSLKDRQIPTSESNYFCRESQEA
jgi:hypothetical protein